MLHGDKCIVMLALSMTIAIIVAKKSVTQKPIVESLQNDNDGGG